ncbi:MAG: hypothetical protein ABMA26_16585 [Limisphaerales bacterium]
MTTLRPAQAPFKRTTRRILLPLLLSLGCLLLPACRRRRAAPPPDVQAANDSVAAAPAGNDPAPTRVLPPPPPAEPSAAVAGRLDLNEVNQRIRDFRENNGRMPRSIEELVTTKYLPVMPPVPPGMKLVLGPDKERAVLVGR